MKGCFFSLILLLGFSVPAYGADPLVVEMQQVYEKMESFSGEFRQELTHVESGSTEKRTGKLDFQKPLLIRWETFDPFPELLVVNQKEVWDYLPDEELAYRYSPEVVQDSRSILQVVTGQARLDQDFDVKREKDKDGFAVLRLYPKEPTTQLVEAVLTVDPASKLLRSAELYDFYGNTNRVEFTKITPNAKPAANAFTFTPPKNITIEDLNEEGAAARPLLN